MRLRDLHARHPLSLTIEESESLMLANADTHTCNDGSEALTVCEGVSAREVMVEVPMLSCSPLLMVSAHERREEKQKLDLVLQAHFAALSSGGAGEGVMAGGVTVGHPVHPLLQPPLPLHVRRGEGVKLTWEHMPPLLV